MDNFSSPAKWFFLFYHDNSQILWHFRSWILASVPGVCQSLADTGEGRRLWDRNRSCVSGCSVVKLSLASPKPPTNLRGGALPLAVAALPRTPHSFYPSDRFEHPLNPALCSSFLLLFFLFFATEFRFSRDSQGFNSIIELAASVYSSIFRSIETSEDNNDDN